MPLVAAPATFAGGLPGTAGLPPIVQPLGHEVSPLATPGLIVAHARPVPVATGGALPPVQRRASRTPRSDSTAAHRVVAEEVPIPAPVEAQVAADPAVAMPTASPARSLPTVSRLTIRLPDRPLTSAASAARPAAVQRITASPATAATPAPRAAPTGGMRRAPGAPAGSLPTISRTALSPRAGARPALPSPAAPASGPRTPGLGAPLAAAPASARPVVNNATVAVPLPVSRLADGALPPPAAAAHRRASTSSTSPAAAGGPTARALPAGEPSVQLPILPVVSVARSVAPARTTAAGEDRPVAAVPAVRPVLGARPIQPAVHVQRTAEPESAAHDGLPSPWWAPAAAADPIALPAFGGHPAVDAEPGTAPPRGRPASDGLRAATTADASSGSDTGGAAGRAVAVQRTMTHALARPIARPAAGAAPDPAGQPVARPAVSHASPLVPGLPQSIVRAPMDPVTVQTSPAAGATAPTRVAGPAPGGPTVQRADAQPDLAQRPGTGSSPAHSDTDLEELAQALYGRIRGRLRGELIHDREARGLSFDNV
jgi:hypothetical protein